VELLGLGEALHGSEPILRFRNRLFQRLVTAHGFSAIAVESSFPRGRLVNEYVAGRGPASFDAVQEVGFSHGFGRLAATRELVEWMRHYNSDPGCTTQLHFYCFDSPTEMYGADSPRVLLEFVLDYLESNDAAAGEARRRRMEPLIGRDADWENPGATFDPAKSIGLSPEAAALRIETEDLIAELQTRRPELVARSDARRYREAVHYASQARQFLGYHAALARPSGQRIADLLGIRDAMMADNLAYMVAQQRGRGKVLAFAHNSHLKCGKAQWQLGSDALTWWPAGAHVREMLGPRYAVIGQAVGESAGDGIGAPEAGKLEALMMAGPGPARFLPTRGGRGLPAEEIAKTPTRTAQTRNQSYFPLTALSVAEFDGWVMVE
jgi:erythromycin esterase-like protein